MAAFARARVAPRIVAGAATARHDGDDLALTQIADAHVGRRNLLVSLSDDELSPAALAARVVVAETARTLVSEGRWAGASLLES